jgi:phosphoserine phosphatase RsbU/P
VTTDFPLDLHVLNRVLDYLNDAVYITDRQRHILLWNGRAQEITGYSSNEVLGRRCRDSLLNHVDKEGQPLCTTDRCPLYRAMHAHARSETPEIIYAMTLARGRIPVSVSVAPLLDDEGNTIGGIEIFRDESASLRDLEFARRIQRNVLTADVPRFATLDLAVWYQPRDLVGGDFYEITQLAPDTASILVADILGHGVSAALYTMLLKSMSQNLRAVANRPAQFMTALNRELTKLTFNEVFATAVYLAVDGRSGTVRFAVAGHPPPLKVNSGNSAPEELAGSGMLLGFNPEEPYEEFEARLDPGETLLAYTDGATDIRDASDESLGVRGLADMVRRLDWTSGDGALHRLQQALLRRCAAVQLPDDLLLLSCTKRPDREEQEARQRHEGRKE